MSDPEIIRVSDIERDAVVERLRMAEVDGLLTPEELNTLTEAAYSSQTPGELAKVINDLPGRSSDIARVRDKPVGIFSMFANIARPGWQRAGGRILARPLLLGGFELDLREAVVPPDAEQIKLATLIGSIEVIVPDGASVELTGFTLIGRREIDIHKDESVGSPPTVRVHAFTLFGSVLVRS